MIHPALDPSYRIYVCLICLSMILLPGAVWDCSLLRSSFERDTVDFESEVRQFGLAWMLSGFLSMGGPCGTSRACWPQHAHVLDRSMSTLPIPRATPRDRERSKRPTVCSIKCMAADVTEVIHKVTRVGFKKCDLAPTKAPFFPSFLILLLPSWIFWGAVLCAGSSGGLSSYLGLNFNVLLFAHKMGSSTLFLHLTGSPLDYFLGC